MKEPSETQHIAKKLHDSVHESSIQNLRKNSQHDALNVLYKCHTNKSTFIMNQQPALYLHEEILLLALKDQKGTIASSATMYQYAVGGAILAELLLQKRIKIDGSSKNKLVGVESSQLTGDDILDECLLKMSGAKRRASAQTWLTRFSGVKHLKHRVAVQLCRKNILKENEDKVLLFFNRKVYPEINHEPEQKIVNRLKEAIFTDSRQIEPRTIILLSLAYKSNLLSIIFDKKELKARKNRIEGLVNGEIIGKATANAIEAVQAAIMIAAMTPIFISTTITN